MIPSLLIQYPPSVNGFTPFYISFYDMWGINILTRKMLHDHFVLNTLKNSSTIDLEAD